MCWWQNVSTLRARTSVCIDDALTRVERALQAREWQVALRGVEAFLSELDHPRAVCALLAMTHPHERIRREAEALHRDVLGRVRGVLVDPRLFALLGSAPVDGADLELEAARSEVIRLARSHASQGTLAEREALGVARDTLARLMALYRRNLASGDSEIALQSLEELEGLESSDLTKNLRASSQGWSLVLSRGLAEELLRCGTQEETRRKAWLALRERAWPDNKPVIEALIDARHAMAHALGKPDWAHLEFAHADVATLDATEQLLVDIESFARPLQEQAFSVLRAAQGEAATRPWNLLHAQNLLHAYAPASDSAHRGVLLELASSLLEESLGWRISAPKGASIWAQGVRVWQVDMGNGRVGRIYLDLSPRPGKSAGFRTMRVRTGVAQRAEPEVAIVASLAEHTPLKHSDVCAFFHEIGHVVQHLSASVSAWGLLNGLPWDRAEAELAPRLFESWAWRREILSALGWSPEAAQVLSARAGATRASAVMRQVLYSAYSLRMHQAGHIDAGLENFDELMFERYGAGAEYAEALYTHFPHLLAYGANYASYLWAQVWAEGIAGHLGIKEGAPQAIAPFVEQVLARPPSIPLKEAICALLGAPCTMDAFKRWLSSEGA